jgi:hypothetical protein
MIQQYKQQEEIDTIIWDRSLNCYVDTSKPTIDLSEETVTGLQLLRILNDICCRFTSIERAPEKVSNSELKRWILNKAVLVNGNPISNTEVIKRGDINSIVLFPKKNRITIL